MINLLLSCALLGSVEVSKQNIHEIINTSYQCEIAKEVQEWIPLINKYFRSEESTLAITVLYCESSGRSKVTGYNKDGSYDQGLFQINSNTEQWLEEKIYKRELDMYDAETNVKVSSWIVENIGNWSWWNSSKKCWGRYGISN